MEAKSICPYCMGELENRVSVCPHCGGVLAGRNPAGSLSVGTLLAGRYTVGEMQSIDGEGILYPTRISKTVSVFVSFFRSRIIEICS